MREGKPCRNSSLCRHHRWHNSASSCSEIAVGALHEAPAVSVRLTEIGRVVDEVISSLPARYSNLTADHYEIMPNHIHLILRIEAGRALREAPLREGETRSLLSKAVGYLKMNSSKRLHEKRPGMEVFRRGYHEHVIRGEKDHLEIWESIDKNPAKRAEDRYHTPQSCWADSAAFLFARGRGEKK